MENRNRTLKGRRVQMRAVNGILTKEGTRRATTQVMVRKSTRLLAAKGDPSTPMIR